MSKFNSAARCSPASIAFPVLRTFQNPIRNPSALASSRVFSMCFLTGFGLQESTSINIPSPDDLREAFGGRVGERKRTSGVGRRLWQNAICNPPRTPAVNTYIIFRLSGAMAWIFPFLDAFCYSSLISEFLIFDINYCRVVYLSGFPEWYRAKREASGPKLKAWWSRGGTTLLRQRGGIGHPFRTSKK